MIAEKSYIIDETDLYKIIGLKDDCPPEELNKTYKSLAKQFHPDILKLGNPEENEKAKKIFSKITSAYNTLKDPDKRKQYDYERRLRMEYQRTLELSRSFSAQTVQAKTQKPGGISISITINNTADTRKPKEETSQQAKDDQTGKLFNSAMDKFGKGDIDGAILELQTAITINPKVAKYHSCLGLMMQQKGWQGYALSEFKKALQLDPKDKLALKYTATHEETAAKPAAPAKKEVKQETVFLPVKLLRFFLTLFKK